MEPQPCMWQQIRVKLLCSSFWSSTEWPLTPPLQSALLLSVARTRLRKAPYLDDWQDGTTPVHVAASRGHVAVLEFLARKGCNVNALGRVCVPDDWILDT
eukprot:m.524037 g.524037  ORF g.524037 m.524037 type:complete len:100 (-) comp57528_c0_seq27:69-368(-)